MKNRFYKLQKAYQQWQSLDNPKRQQLSYQLRRYRLFNCWYLAILTIIAIPLIYWAFFMSQPTGQGLKQLGAVLIIIGYGLVVHRTIWTHKAYRFVVNELEQNTTDEQEQTHS